MTVTEDLPTPPLPEATAYTRVSELGLLNGISFSATPPRSFVRRSARCCSLMTSRRTSTELTPSTRSSAAVVSWRSLSLSGQPGTVR